MRPDTLQGAVHVADGPGSARSPPLFWRPERPVAGGVTGRHAPRARPVPCLSRVKTRRRAPPRTVGLPPYAPAGSRA